MHLPPLTVSQIKKYKDSAYRAQVANDNVCCSQN